MQPLDRPNTSDSSLHKIGNITDYKHLMSDTDSKQQAGPLFRWLLDLRKIDESHERRIVSNSDFHNQLAYKNKRPNTTTSDFKSGNINKVRHVLDNKSTTHGDCSFMFNLRSQDTKENKNKDVETQKWSNCPFTALKSSNHFPDNLPDNQISMYPSKNKGIVNGKINKSFASPRSGSKKLSYTDDKASDYTQNNKNKSKTVNKTNFDSKQFQEERYSKVQNGLEAVLQRLDVSKYDNSLKNNTTALDYKYLNCPGKNMESFKFELGLRSYHENKKKKKDKNEKQEIESLMSKSQK